jgi:hypothetical protein
MAEKIEPTACDGRLSEANSNNQPALYGAFASKSQALIGDVSAGAENKDLARTRAIAKWPAHADLFARKKDVDKAEACLIGWAGLQREASR